MNTARERAPADGRDRAPARSSWRAPLLIAFGYLVLGVLWILFSDRLLALASPTMETLARWQTYKGWGYVVVTAALLYGMLRVYVARRRQAESALRESEGQLRALFEAIPDIVFLLDEDGVVEEVSKPTVAGYGRDEIVGLHFLDAPFIGEHDRKTVYGILEALPEGEEIPRYLFEAQTRDGETRYGEVNATRMTGATRTRIVGVVRDVTERVRAEEKLRESERMLAEAEKVAHLGCWEWMVPKDTIHWSKEERRIFGVDPDGPDLTFAEVIAMAHPDDRPAVHQTVRQALAGEGPYEFETRIIRPDGETRHIETRAQVYRDERGEPVRVLGTTLDVTQRRRDQQALHESERRYRTFFQTSRDCIFITSKDGRWIDMNEAAVELFGYESREELQKVRIPDLYENPAERASHLRTIERQGYTREYPVNLQRKDGSVINTLITSVPTKDEDGTITGFMGTIRDVTEQVRAEEALRQHREHLQELVAERTAELDERVAEVERLNRALTNLLEDLQRANRRLEETTGQLQFANRELESFAYSVSHDLRAPLRALSGFSRILLEEHAPDLPAEAARYARLVQENAEQMGRLIDDLLAFSRLSRQPLSKQEVAPAALAQQVLDDLRQAQEGRRLEIAIDDLPSCEADPSLLRQVFVNLLSNALKFTRQRDVARIHVGCEEQDGENVYFVQDNGVGFDMRYVDKLFGVFQRLHASEDYEGTGVGLAIVQRIVQRHGGRVWAEGQVDQGATFYFTIPGA